MPHPRQTVDLWSLEGQFDHVVFSPKGEIEGLMINTDGVPTQVITDTRDRGVSELIQGLVAGQKLVLEGAEASPPPEGQGRHAVYHFERLVSVDGKTPRPLSGADEASGTVVRLNYARHGAANGVVLDTGDFIHTRPEGFARLGLETGDKVHARGAARSLSTGSGRVIEAHTVNGKPVEPAL